LTSENYGVLLDSLLKVGSITDHIFFFLMSVSGHFLTMRRLYEYAETGPVEETYDQYQLEELYRQFEE